MILVTRLLFIFSLLTFIIFTLDFNLGVSNLTLLYIFIIGFSLTFILAFINRKQRVYRLMLWVSAAIVLLFVCYSVLVNFLWGIFA